MSTHTPEAALHDYADGRLDARAAAGVERHLAACAGCRAELRHIQSLRARLAALPGEAEPRRDLWTGVAARLEGAEAAAAVAEPADGIVSLPERLRARRAPRVQRMVWRAAAAVVLFAGGVGVGRVTADEAVPASPPPAIATAPAGDPMLAAAEVQRTGTAYVSAVAAFAALHGAASEGEMAQGRDAALAAMYGAARELTQLPQADASARTIYHLVSRTRDPRGVSF